jgi:two-component system KDP operon response regulator KdpE
MKRILVVEDHDPVVYQLKQILQGDGYEVHVARKGRDALDLMAHQHIDLVLLDLGLPDISGLQVCKNLRNEYPGLPIIILSVKSDEHDKVQALNLGADDYVSKPYYTNELLARIKIQFLHVERMRSGTERRKFVAGPLEVNLAQRRVKVNGQEIELTLTEFELLRILIINNGKMVTYDLILSHVWNDEDDADRKNIHVYVNRLRKKIETPAGRRYIFNAPKIGYRFQAEEN